MARRSRQVDQAILRWVTKGLLSPDQAAALQEESATEHRRRSRRWGQLILAVIGAFALLMAAVLFVQRTWAALTGPAQTGIIVGAGVLAYLIGLVVGGRVSWRYSGPLLQAGGLLVVLVGVVYSLEVWDQGTLGARLIGLLAILVPVLTARRSIREGVAMIGAHVAITFLFLAMFFHRTLGLDPGGVYWALDVVVLLAVAATVMLLRSGRPDATDRALAALAVSLWAGLVMVFLTAGGPLEMGSDSLLPMDVWLAIVAGVTLWAIGRATSEDRLQAFEFNLALCVLIGGGMAMSTGAEVLKLGTEVWAPMGGVVGGLGLLYGLRRESQSVLRAGALVVLFSVWIFSLEQGGAIGAVLALVATAVLFFWLAGRVSGMDAGRPFPESDDGANFQA
jgi:uncharacterized membrane protein